MGCKVDKYEVTLKFTQPVMLQIFEGNIDFLKGKATGTPVQPVSTVRKATSEYTPVSKDRIKYSRSVVGKLLHMMSWSRTEIYNLVGDLYSHMRKALGRNIKEMHRIMNYFVAPTNRVLYLEPNCKWYGKYKYFGFLNSNSSMLLIL